MSAVVIKPQKLRGRVAVPPSKSIAHRAIIAAALAQGQSVISNVDFSKDIEATLGCVQALGAVCEYDGANLSVDGARMLQSGGRISLDCIESGSTLRFLMPIALLRGGRTRFYGAKSLMERPLGPYEELFARKGITFSREQNGIVIEGLLESGDFELPGDVSSQFVTGLLFALPLLDADSRIKMTSPLQSRPYVDLTLSVLKDFGINIRNDNYEVFIINGGQSYASRNYFVEGDYSQAAFWLTANALGSDIVCEGLNIESLQGDKAIVGFIQNGDRVLDVSETPDLAPILTVLCALRPGESRIVGAGRLRMKESDRLHTITVEMNKLGANIAELEDSLVINGVEKLHGAEVDSHNDHRIPMALAIAATCCEGGVIIHGAECISKSYPTFFEHYFNLKGGKV